MMHVVHELPFVVHGLFMKAFINLLMSGSCSVHECLYVLFVLMLNIPVNNFSVMPGQSHRFLGITSTFQGVNVNS